MTCSRWLALAAALLLITTPSQASLKDIRTEKLPQVKAIQKVYADVATVEDFVRDWSDKWRYETPKEQVASLLKASLDELQKALATAPDNEELLLLTGLVAHYAYNVDVDGSYKLAMGSLHKAHSLAPDDYRAEWFLGVHECQAGHIKEGMGSLLQIENRLPWQQLPLGFWDDYMSCATVALLPAHTLRAGEYARKLNAPTSKSRDFLLGVAQKRYKKSDPNADYSSSDLWQVKEAGPKKVLTNFMFGLTFSIPGGWKLGLGDAQHGQCAIKIKAGPYPGKSGDVIPNILVLVRQAKPGESLGDFIENFLPDPSARPTSESSCPAQECLSFEVVKPGSYTAEGGGHALIRGLRRDAPEFPGLLLEEPAAPPSTEGGKATYFHPTERFERLPGTLFYGILLDCASSVFGKAKSDYETFLKSFQAE